MEGASSRCCIYLVPMARIERATSPLPRECSTTELHRRNLFQLPYCVGRLAGAGEGNRTLVISLEGFCSTIELHPPCPPSRYENPAHSPRGRSLINSWWRGKDSNLRRQSRQIYSLLPLTAREPLRTKRAIMRCNGRSVKRAPRQRRRRRKPAIGSSNPFASVGYNPRPRNPAADAPSRACRVRRTRRAPSIRPAPRRFPWPRLSPPKPT